jgi:hypothetical protein
MTIKVCPLEVDLPRLGDTGRAPQAQQQYGGRSRGDDNAAIRIVRLHHAYIRWGLSDVHNSMKPECVPSCEIYSNVEDVSITRCD